MNIALLAGEQSGDILGAGLIHALRRHYPQAQFSGIGGERMQAAGLNSLAPIELLSVMGLVEPLQRLPQLIALRKRLFQHFSRQQPAVFIGIDAPDFNLGLEYQLRQTGIKTVHYVSPSVWAWRRWRIKKIARSVDLMLTLFPFEAQFYQQANISVCCVGHPLADTIPLVNDPKAARAELHLNPSAKVVALLPGSRMSEIQRLAPVFLATAEKLRQQRSDLHFILPVPTTQIAEILQPQLTTQQVQLVNGQSRTAMAAADVILLASGTATLEGLLLKRPMVVAYKTAPLTAFLARWLVKVPHFSLPNLLAGTALVAEFFQQQVKPEQLSQAVLELLDNDNETLIQRFAELHQMLKKNASEQAARAISALLGHDAPDD